jgi:CDP-diacylglycerol--glycerol-3-phosphate 3-phosphatidyltransferase
MSTEHPVTLQDRVRAFTARWMERIGTALHRAHIHPDFITLLGLVFVLVAAVFIARGQLQLGGLILLLGLPLDALDGAVARAMGRAGKFGSVLDSTLDRYADSFIFAALGYYYASQDRLDYLLLAMAALIGSFGVSYVRARAGEAGISVRVGLFDRMVRIIIILTMLLISSLAELGLGVLAIGTNFTALQRLWYVYKLHREVPKNGV